MTTLPTLKNSLRLGNPYPVLDATSASAEDVRPEDTSDNPWAEASLLVLKRFDPSRYLRYPKNSQDEQTGQEWIRDVDAYKTWIGQEDCDRLQQRDDQLRLCISGGSDTDRTALTLFILEELPRLSARGSAKTQVLYFFCHHSHEFCNNASAILKGWLYQLVQQRPDLTTKSCQWICDFQPRVLFLNNPAALWNVLRCALKGTPEGDNAGTTYCIINGLHECNAESVKIIEELLTRPFPLEGCLENEPSLKFMFTSRLPIASNKFGKIDLDEHVGNGLDAPTILQDTLLDAFLQGLEGEIKTLCLQLLDTVTAYRYPPTTKQLQSFLDEPDDEIQKRILLCHPFIRANKARMLQCVSMDVWQIFSKSERAPAIHSKLARHCLDVIDRELPRIGMEHLEHKMDIWEEVTPLVQYSCVYWAEHVKLSQDVSEDILTRITDTFSRNSTVIEKWWIIYLHVHMFIHQDNLKRQHHTTVLHLIAFFGLDELLQTACNSGQWPWLRNYLETDDCLQMDPLLLAISRSHTKTAELLVNQGTEISFAHCITAAGSNMQIADLIFSCYKSKPPMPMSMAKMLERVVVSDNKELVSRTIRFLRVISPNTFPWNEIDALKLVIDTGKRQLVSPLLSITRYKEVIEEVIEYAVEKHEEVILADLMNMPEVRRFIEDEKVTLTTALNMALRHKCPLMVNWLMSNANVNDIDDADHTPLQVATRNANHQTLCRFLQHPNFVFNNGIIEEGVALNVLLHTDKVEVDLMNLKQLLDRGARMRYEHFGITALHVAAELGRTPVMEVLLEKMSEKEIEEDINREPSSMHGPERSDKTALAIAAMKGYCDIVKLLLLRGANKEIKDRRRRTAMDLAEEGGHAEIVELLRKSKKGR